MTNRTQNDVSAARGSRGIITAGVLLGLGIMPFGALSASAVGCADDAALTSAAATADLPAPLGEAFADGVLTGGEVQSAGYTFSCSGDGSISFAQVAQTTPTPTPEPSVDAAPSAPPIVETAPPAVSELPAALPHKAPAATKSSRPATATASAPVGSAPVESPAPVAAPPAEALAATAPSAPADDEAALGTLAQSGASVQDERAATEALSDTSLSSSRGALPGIGVIAGLSGAAALALGGIAALIGRTGDRRPRHSR